jgi:hypothetical protein
MTSSFNMLYVFFLLIIFLKFSCVLFSLGNFTFLEWLEQGHQFALGMFHV